LIAPVEDGRDGRRLLRANADPAEAMTSAHSSASASPTCLEHESGQAILFDDERIGVPFFEISEISLTG
jgi:hypothetical protein